MNLVHDLFLIPCRLGDEHLVCEKKQMFDPQDWLVHGSGLRERKTGVQNLRLCTWQDMAVHGRFRQKVPCRC